MKRFIGQLSILTITIIMGVFIGMQQANEGILQMRGYEDPDFKGAFQISELNNEQFEASVLGHSITKETIQEKQEKMKELDAFNFFSSLGNQIETVVHQVFERLIQLFIVLFDKVIS